MQRDIGNEVVVAIIVVAVLAFALTFGIILSLSNTGSNSPGVAQSNVATLAASPTDDSTLVAAVPSEAAPTASATATQTDMPMEPATETKTEQPSATSSEEPTVTLTPTTTVTASPAPTSTRTASPTDTATPAPSATPTALPTHTPTKPPTQTPTATMTATAPPTRTPTSTATVTATNTATRAPSATPTLTPTNTLTATHTPRPTATPTRKPTATIPPTATPTTQPSATFTRTSTAARAPSATPLPTSTTVQTEVAASICIAPFGWTVYEARSGDTVEAIAQAAGTSAAELRAGNCLGTSGAVSAGQTVYVPRQPVGLQPPPLASNVLAAEGCTSPGTVITSPIPRQHLSGIFEIRGTAIASNFAYYRIEIRPNAAQVYNFYARFEQPVVNEVLTAMDTRTFGPGLYWLKISVVDRSGSDATTSCAIPVYFD